MILIADSGSTKTDWTLVPDRLVGGGTVAVTTQGITPVHQTPETIRKILEQELMPQIAGHVESLSSVYFYGSGCSPAHIPVMQQLLRETLNLTGGQTPCETPLTEGLSPCEFNIGDRVKVRITIDCTRDLDFVQVCDRRAACMEPVRQLSGYQQGAYVSPKDAATHYFYYGLAKGKHVIETEYYIDRAGRYETGTCTVGCAYAPEYRATAPSMTLNVK